MSLKVPDAPQQYSKQDQDQVRRALKNEDEANIKSGQILTKLLFRDTSTDTVRTVVVTAGVLVVS